MNKRQIDRYFSLVDKIYEKKCRIILTGAAAGVLYGRVRPTMDVDFEAGAADWDGFLSAVKKASDQTGIESQFSEDIDHWSSITLMDYREHIYLYGKFGKLAIYLMEPAYWAIGKLSRYLDQDVQDMVRVFKKTGTNWKTVAEISGKALKKSPKSTACFLFRKQTEDFLKNRGREVWGKKYNADEAIIHFHKYAGIQ